MQTITHLITTLFSQFNRSERGQALILGVIAFFALMGFTAMAIDVGVGFGAKSQAQRAADSAAYAAALEHLLVGGTDAEAAQAAYRWAAANGYDDADPDTTVVVNIPPLSGPHAGDTFFVEVIIYDQEGTYFANVLGTEFWDIKARAVATLADSPKPYSIITLDPTACKATNVDGSVIINITDAGTFTQSNCEPDAFHTQGSIIVDTADNDVVGGWQAGGSVEPPPSKAYPITDPLLGLLEPVPPAAPVHPCPDFSGPASTMMLDPGVYTCLIDPPGGWDIEFNPGDYLFEAGFVADGNGSATFGSGIYTFRGVGMLITGGGTVTANEVMFYIDEGEAVFDGSGVTSLTAPTSGDYEGVAIFQARDNTSDVIISGNAATGGWGTIYAPAAMIDFSGNAITSFQFISKTFWAHGNSHLQVVYNSGFSTTVPYIWLAE
ncbi:MAG: hypothetical protein IH957_03535 [Chloroflexi bacterium]|nr:hypothetical protein [Chloroflexota bacterium]